MSHGWYVIIRPPGIVDRGGEEKAVEVFQQLLEEVVSLVGGEGAGGEEDQSYQGL